MLIFGETGKRRKPPVKGLTQPELAIMAILRRAKAEGRHVNVKMLRDELKAGEHQVRLYIQHMQDQGAPVCTTAHGVELAETPEQIERQFERMKNHSLKQLYRAYRLPGLRLTDRLRQQTKLEISQVTGDQA